MLLQERADAPSAGRHDAVNQQTGSHQIEQRARFVQQRAAVVGVNQRDVDSLQLCQQLCKSPSLRARKTGIVFHRRIMGVKTLDFQTGQAPRPDHQLARLFRRDAQPAHAGVHLDVCVYEPVQSDRSARKLSGFAQSGNGGSHTVPDRRFDFARQAGAQHQHGPTFAHAVNGARLGQVRHAENVRAALHQQGSDLLQSMPVGVRLHHRHDLYLRPGPVTYPGEILPQGVEVDLRPTTKGLLHADQRNVPDSGPPASPGVVDRAGIARAGALTNAISRR